MKCDIQQTNNKPPKLSRRDGYSNIHIKYYTYFIDITKSEMYMKL